MRKSPAPSAICASKRTVICRKISGRALAECRACEPFAIAETVLGKIEENYHIAEEQGVPICQDTGLACVFLEVGQDIHIEGSLKDAVDEGVRRGYTEGYLRKSCVKDPIDRVNTGDNTPAVIYYDIVPGTV